MPRRILAWTLPAVGIALGGCPHSLDNAQCMCKEDEVCVYGRCEPGRPSAIDGWYRPDFGDAGEVLSDSAEPPPPESDGPPPPECESLTFKVSETQESFTTPSNVRYMHIKAWGAGGNGEGQCAQDDAGLGGYSEAIFKVTGETKLIIIVGQRGRAGLSGEDSMRFGFGNWGGGGLSGVFRGPETIGPADRSRALIIAGGGGGAGAPGCNPGGPGNHKSSGGEPTMEGGPGVDDVNGGGGGYAGGPGGAKGLGGMGGSGYVSADATDQRMLSSEPESGMPPGTDDPDWADSAGCGESPGRVVIHFVCDKPQMP